MGFALAVGFGLAKSQEPKAKSLLRFASFHHRRPRVAFREFEAQNVLTVIVRARRELPFLRRLRRQPRKVFAGSCRFEPGSHHIA